MLAERIRAAVREVPDFPTPGIDFKDITPIVEDYKLCGAIVNEFADRFSGSGIDAIVGVESRGFLFGMMMAQQFEVPFITVRKKGKLPYDTISYKYELEYGTNEIEMHVDSIKKGWNVLVHDDLLATGGTAAAAAELVKMQKGNIAGFAFIIDLSFLNGIEKLKPYSDNIVKLVSY